MLHAGLQFEQKQYTIMESDITVMVCVMAPNPPLNEALSIVIVDEPDTAIRT